MDILKLFCILYEKTQLSIDIIKENWSNQHYSIDSFVYELFVLKNMFFLEFICLQFEQITSTTKG